MRGKSPPPSEYVTSVLLHIIRLSIQNPKHVTIVDRVFTHRCVVYSRLYTETRYRSVNSEQTKYV